MTGLWLINNFPTKHSQNSLMKCYGVLCVWSCLEQLSGMERFTHKLFDIPPDHKRQRHHSHEHPGEHEAETHATETNTVHMEVITKK